MTGGRVMSKEGVFVKGVLQHGSLIGATTPTGS